MSHLNPDRNCMFGGRCLMQGITTIADTRGVLRLAPHHAPGIMSPAGDNARAPRDKVARRNDRGPI
jgi:hypothetical protein